MKPKSVAKLKKEADKWLVVQETDGLYEVSSSGQVRSYLGVGRYAKRTTEPRPLKPSLNKHRGYLYVSVNKPLRKNWALHRLVAEHHLPRVKGKEHVNHINGNKLDNTVENLEWCTHEENIRHAIETGLIPKYDWRSLTKNKLNPKKAAEIKKLKGQLTYRKIAEKYGVKYSTIAHVMTNRRWKDV